VIEAGRLATSPPGGWWRPLRSASSSIAVSLAALSAGAGLAAVSLRFEDDAPLAFLALAVLPLWAIAVLVHPLVGAIVVFLTLPIGSVGAPLGFITLQAAEAAVLGAGVLIIVRRLAEGRTPLPWSPPLTWALALLGWTLVSFVSAIDKVLALKQIGAVAGGLVFACVVLAACRDMVDVRRLLGGFTAAAAVIAATALSAGEAFQARYGGTQVTGRLEGAFDHPNQLGALCAMAAPVAASLMLGARTYRARVASGIGLVLILAALMLSLARGAWIGAGLAFLLMLAALPEARRLVALLSVPMVGVGLFVSSLTPTTSQLDVIGQRARALTELSPYDRRQEIYAEALREIRAKPVTGFGPGSFPVASARAGSEASTVAAHHAHNLGLTWAAEAGLPALGLILGFAVALGLAARRASRAAIARGRLQDRALVVGLAAALLSVVGQGLVDFTLRNAVVHIALWGLIGALLVCRREMQRAA
jgi:putative inorganic carbon (hco3(-)) transporter